MSSFDPTLDPKPAAFRRLEVLAGVGGRRRVYVATVASHQNLALGSFPTWRQDRHVFQHGFAAIAVGVRVPVKLFRRERHYAIRSGPLDGQSWHTSSSDTGKCR